MTTINTRPTPDTISTLDVYRNQAYREAYLYAVIGERALIEYEMPNGSSALNFVSIHNTRDYRPVSYGALPKKWAKAVIEQSGMKNWYYGNPMSNSTYSQTPNGSHRDVRDRCPSPSDIACN